MNHFLFIGCHPTKKMIRESNGKLDSLYRSDEAIITGFTNNDSVNLRVITCPDIASYPSNNLFYRSQKDEAGQEMVSILNLPVIKFLWTVVALSIKAIKIVSKTKENTIVVIPYMVFKHVIVSRILKILFRNKVEILLIIPDVFFPSGIVKKSINKLTEKFAKRSDFFVLYTEAMAAYLGIERKPYVVIEGFLDIKKQIIKTNNERFILTYTGSLNKRYGIIRLLDSMQFINNNDIELHLYGAGDSEEYIKRRVEEDKRIFFWGKVPKNKAVDAMYVSSALINPRSSMDGDFVEFSFPSKDIDYLSTGIPSILCKLPGMPTEYYGYFIDAGMATPKEIADAVIYLYNLPKEERENIGRRAQSFIEKRMNIDSQILSILSMVQNYNTRLNTI